MSEPEVVRTLLMNDGSGEGQAELHYIFRLHGNDFGSAGSISTKIKKILQQIGVQPDTIRRASIATYEAEMNVVIHAWAGEIALTANASRIAIEIRDEGPGIPDIRLAMQPGYSTAPDAIREMGFGAGMGLSNMDKCADRLEISSEVGQGTTVNMVFNNE